MEPKDWTRRELRHSFVFLLSDLSVTVEGDLALVSHRDWGLSGGLYWVRTSYLFV